MYAAEAIEVMYDAAALRERVAALGAQLTRDYAGKDVVFVCVLKGSVVFFTDLIRAVDLPLTIDFLGLSSYGGSTESSGVVQITSDLARPIAGKHVVVVEDIVDTGLTMAYLLENLRTRQPASVAICSLLVKPSRARVAVETRYQGFVIPDAFVVGYGLDFDERYRNLPCIGVVRAAGG